MPFQNVKALNWEIGAFFAILLGILWSRKLKWTKFLTNLTKNIALIHLHCWRLGAYYLNMGYGVWEVVI